MGWIWERSLLARWKCHSKGQREEQQVVHPMSGHVWTEERALVGLGGSVSIRLQRAWNARLRLRDHLASPCILQAGN